jgi:hypothetical protein
MNSCDNKVLIFLNKFSWYLAISKQILKNKGSI